MKLTTVLLALVGLVTASHVSVSKQSLIADHAFLEKQKFLLEIVYRVEDPLMFEEYINIGKSLVYDKEYYTHFDIRMEQFYHAYKRGALLPKSEFFGALVKYHHIQAFGLFNFFYYAENWETFQQNVAWARIHINEGMFVYALTLAVIHRDDFKGLRLPAIYEILPQYFFNSKFIYGAKKFDFNTWSKYNQYEKEFNDVYHKNNIYNHNNDYFYIKDFKTYQWWKLMGLGEQWYSYDAEISFPLRENSYEILADNKYISFMKNVNMFWCPVDYTRDIEIFNKHSVLSYLTEDLGWNSYWYYLNMDYGFFLDGESFRLNKNRRGEWWTYITSQLLSRYNIERLSNGLSELPEISWYQPYEYGYDPELISYNGAGYSYRKNYYELQSYGDYEMLDNIHSTWKRIYTAIDHGYYITHEGQKINLRNPESIQIIGNILQCNNDAIDKYFFSYWYMLNHMYLSNVNYYDVEVLPSVWLNFETMMRDPMFYTFHKKIADAFHHWAQYLPSYTQAELAHSGVEIEQVEVSELITYWDLVDFDVTNLLNDKITFDDGKFVWDKSLYARQIRLNHKPFHYNMTVKSDKEQQVVIRVFYGAKFDEYGRIISLKENQKNFVALDEFVYKLSVGENAIKRSSHEFPWAMKDHTTYTELYHFVMAAYEGKYELPLELIEPHCGYPDRLVLPKGWKKGFPVQLFFYISSYERTTEDSSNDQATFFCDVGSGAGHVDSKPFVYPFDRPIDETEFVVPNMYFKDVSIYHNDTLMPYYEDYNNKGHFDYSFYNDYYTKFFH